MDLVGSLQFVTDASEIYKFQSFWVNGFGWKKRYTPYVLHFKLVSILLSQWIWLEVPPVKVTENAEQMFQSFWVNGFGWKGGWADTFFSSAFVFQSFWVNGFGWKRGSRGCIESRKRVSILLSQWIWLEETSALSIETSSISFNPSESMDLVGRSYWSSLHIHYRKVSILLSQWIWLEGICPINTDFEVDGFNPSESMDLVGRIWCFGLRSRLFQFQSFWVNGFGWKSSSIV